MRGQIVAVNRTNGMFIVQVEDGSYTVVELLGGYDIVPGQIVSGNLQDHASEQIRNHDSGETMDCYIQGYDCSWEHAHELAS